ncbi:hypothetical protein PSHT_00756 [Puccinia striiformis]|uniref:Uncharacterized protein n=1 Tax=Puccinia striiformis TaxID=27350 RepID=A0A2S4WMG4_9BASI|nr:hypothetical protein PSHT_00756 [Puccinia striiformis]
MSTPTSSSGEVAPSPRSDSSDIEIIRQQADLVIDEFQNLIAEHNSGGYRRHMQKKSQIERKKELLNQLHANFLPELAQQITTLSLTLDPIHLREQTIFTLEQILMIQSYLHQSLVNIESAIGTLCPSPDIFLPGRYGDGDQKYKRINDQQHREFKAFRTNRLFDMELLNRDHSRPPHIDVIRESILGYSSSSCKEIESTIRWLEGSEFELVQWDWPNEICRMNEQMGQLLSIINRIPSNEGNREDEDETHIESDIVLARSTVPIFKLCRLFFNKLSKLNMDKRWFPLFSEMRTDQLDRLYNLAGGVRLELGGFIKSLPYAHRFHDHRNLEDVIDIAQLFEPCLFLIFHYFVPFLPETNSHPAQSNLRAWLETWYDQLDLAVQLYQRALKVYDRSLR